MPGKRPSEPIGPTTIPGQPMDPKIPPDQAPELDDESDGERQARESEKAFDQATTRFPPS
jgi:hypothetical protein